MQFPTDFNNQKGIWILAFSAIECTPTIPIIVVAHGMHSMHSSDCMELRVTCGGRGIKHASLPNPLHNALIPTPRLLTQFMLKWESRKCIWMLWFGAFICTSYIKNYSGGASNARSAKHSGRREPVAKCCKTICIFSIHHHFCDWCSNKKVESAYECTDSALSNALLRFKL